MLHLPDTGIEIKSTGIAEARNFSLSLIQVGASERFKLKLHIRYDIYHYS